VTRKGVPHRTSLRKGRADQSREELADLYNQIGIDSSDIPAVMSTDQLAVALGMTPTSWHRNGIGMDPLFRILAGWAAESGTSGMHDRRRPPEAVFPERAGGEQSRHGSPKQLTL
jgi:hypothetical protein